MKKNLFIFFLFFGLIYVLTGPPREGKSFYATYKALCILKKGKEKVFSNYPIIYRKPLTIRQRTINIYRRYKKLPLIQNKIISSIPWKYEYMNDVIYDASIFIDESYEDYFSREWKEHGKEMLEWFATNGHNLLDVWLIAQNSGFVDVNIRRLTNYFIMMRKKYLLWQIGFLWFTAEYYLSESEMNMRNRKLDLSYTKDRLTMRTDVKAAYDTHYFRCEGCEKRYETWYDILHEVPQEKFSVNWGKIIMAVLILAGFLIVSKILSTIFL